MKRATLLILVFFFLLVSSLFISLFTWPSLVVNPTVLGWGAAIGRKVGYDVHWDEVRINAKSLSMLHQSYDLDFKNLCLDIPQGLLADSKGCFERFSVTFETAWNGKRWVVPAFGPLTATGGDFFIPVRLAPAKPDASAQTRGRIPLLPRTPIGVHLPELVLPSRMRETVFQSISIDIPRAKVVQGENIYAGGVAVTLEPDAFGHPAVATLGADLFEGLKFEALSVSAHLSSNSRFRQNDWILDLDAIARQSQKSEANAELEIFQTSPGVFAYRLDAQAVIQGGQFTISTSGSISGEELAGKVTASGKEFMDEVHEVTLKDCPYRFHETEASSGRGRFDFDCPLHVDLTPLQLPSGTFTKLVTVPYNLDFTVQTDLETDLIPTPSSRIEGRFDIGLFPLSREFFDVKGGMKGRFSGVPSEYPEGWEIVADSNFSFASHQFQKIVHALERTAFAVPAPLNALDGSIEFQLTGRSNLIGNTGTVPVTFKTRLKSIEQDVNTDGEGELVYHFVNKAGKTKLTLELLLSQVKLALPRFGYSSLPNLFLDSRIKPAEQGKKKIGPSLAWDYHIKVKTGPEPARLVSNLVQENIPLILDMDIINGKLGGTITVGGATLNLFRKRAHLEELKIVLRDPREMSEVTGRIHAVYADYRIDVFIVGTVGKPRVIFESVPPLSEEQIVAALLYGQPFGDLNETESASVANTSAALAQKSVALGSIFLLASTPVESVSYNPETGAFTAKVRLSEGTLLRVTTQEKKQEFGVRKNVTGNWVINTYVENDSEERKQTGVVLFEWLKRY